MRVLHVPFGYWPDPVGGTEVYVRGLVRELSVLGVENEVAAPSSQSLEYLIDGIQVHRYFVPEPRSLEELYGAPDERVFDSFYAVLVKHKPDIVHLHAHTHGVSAQCALAAKQRGCKLIWTYHTPTVSCARGTMMRFGREVCDGKIDTNPCARCALQSRTGSLLAARLLTTIPHAWSRSLSTKAHGKWRTALQLPHLLQKRAGWIHDMLALPDRWVAVCDWVADVLRGNGVGNERLFVCRQGVDQLPVPVESIVNKIRSNQAVVRIGFFGRISSEKGLDVLLDAMSRIPSADIELRIHPVVQGQSGKAHLEQLKARTVNDQRIHWSDSVAASEVVQAMQELDYVCIPSTWLETGPLVVLESFAAGTPVIGSRLGGIAEMVKHEFNGWLIEPGNVKAWASGLKHIANEKNLRQNLVRNIRSPRTMREVAHEHNALYQSLVAA